MHAKISGHRGSKGVNNRQSERETQADKPAQSGLIYLLLDVAVGDRNGARGPVEEVLVGGDLTRLHRTCTSQLLHRNREKVKQQKVYFSTFYHLHLSTQHADASLSPLLHLYTH